MSAFEFTLKYKCEPMEQLLQEFVQYQRFDFEIVIHTFRSYVEKFRLSINNFLMQTYKFIISTAMTSFLWSISLVIAIAFLLFPRQWSSTNSSSTVKITETYRVAADLCQNHSPIKFTFMNLNSYALGESYVHPTLEYESWTKYNFVEWYIAVWVTR